MVDAQQFRKWNPNYARLAMKKPHTDMFGQILDHEIVDRVRSNGMDLSELKEEDPAICSPTVLGFSLNEKVWGSWHLRTSELSGLMSLGEFAVEKVAEIQFSDTPFDMLAIPEDKKRVIKSLTESRVRATTEGKFDDIIEGKGQGVIILLQYVSEPIVNGSTANYYGKRTSRRGEDFDSRSHLRTTSATALLGISSLKSSRPYGS
jgi:hypothetical protein